MFAYGRHTTANRDCNTYLHADARQPRSRQVNGDTNAFTLRNRTGARAVGISASSWKTDFSKRGVPLTEIMSGGPPKDGIPAIDSPKFISTNEAGGWLADSEPVQVVDINGDARAYPLQILIWHEIVNDVVGGKPVAITYCPLCNSAVVFAATLDDGCTFTFGTTGKLRFSDLVMYDRQTESWWQQVTGEAIVGELTGTKLKFLPSSVVSWREFKEAHPGGRVLSQETGYQRDYGHNPYVGYDSGQPFSYQGPKNNRLRAMERVATVELGGVAMAFPFAVLEREPVVQTNIGGQSIVVFYKKGTTSALDASAIAAGRDVGATSVFNPMVRERRLTFCIEGEYFRDDQTATRWNLLGQAVDGPLKSAQLEPMVHADAFWFAWAVFMPNTQIYRGAK